MSPKELDVSQNKDDLTETNNPFIDEYVMNDNNSQRTGIAQIKLTDETVMKLEFNMEATIKVPRVFIGNGTHRWIFYSSG